MSASPARSEHDRIPAGLALACHPTARCDAVARLGARVHRTRDGQLVVAFVLEGELSRLNIPSPGTTRRTSELWRHTCFEAFIGCESDPSYHEINVTPAREWAAYAFARYRQGGSLECDALAPEITVRRAENRLQLALTVDLACFDPRLRDAPLRVGLAAVVEDAQGVLSYWALRHTSERPDFHAPESFAFPIDPPLENSD